DQRCRVPRPCSPTAAASSAHVLSAVWSRQVRSAWPPSRRRKCAPPQASHAACGSTPSRTPLPPVVCARGRASTRWCPKPQLSYCPPPLARPPRHRPLGECAPSAAVSPGLCPCGQVLAVARAPAHSTAPHTSLPRCPLQP